VPRAELACDRVGDDVDGMAAQPDRLALRLLSGPAACRTASSCVCKARGIVPPTCFGGVARASGSTRVSWPTHQAEPGEVVRGGDLFCEAVTCCARRRLLGGSLL
jgi:hypothetical protein